MPDTIPAALYLRHSPRPTAKDIDRHESIEFQRERCELYCGFHRPALLATHTLEDPLESARRPLDRRPDGARLLALIRKGRIKHVVVQKLDRLFRNLVDGLTVLDEWDRRKVILHLADEGGVAASTQTVAGWDFIVMRLWLAEHEPRQTSERTRVANRRYQANGKRVSAIPPYGSMIDATSAVNATSGLPGGLIACPDEQTIIEQMRHWRDTEGLGPRAIAKRLEQLGVPCRASRRWQHTTVMAIFRRLRATAPA